MPTATGNATLIAWNPCTYRGYIYDQETGFYYLQSRYYDPEVGRFINADAFVSTGQGLLGNNMFAYCGNNPVSRADSGGCFWDIIVDPFHTVPHFHIDRRINGTSGKWVKIYTGYMEMLY